MKVANTQKLREIHNSPCSILLERKWEFYWLRRLVDVFWCITILYIKWKESNQHPSIMNKSNSTFQFNISFLSLLSSIYNATHILQSFHGTLSLIGRVTNIRNSLNSSISLVKFQCRRKSSCRSKQMTDSSSAWSIVFPVLILIAWLPIVITTLRMGRNENCSSCIEGYRHYIILFLLFLLHIVMFIVAYAFPYLSKTAVWLIEVE